MKTSLLFSGMRLSVSDSCRVSNLAIKSVLVAAGDKLIVASGDHNIIVNIQTLTELVRAITFFHVRDIK